MNTPVSLEIAKLLKEKGFNEEVRDYYEEKDGTFYYSQYFRDNISINEKHNGFVTAPTIAEVVMWLYEKHGIWINVTSDYNRFRTWQYRITNRNKMIGKDGIIYNEGFNSPTKAYSQAIEYTLKNLI